MTDFYSGSIPTFGVAGNFTGHLEQAGEAVDFLKVKTEEANAPKAIFPTYLPKANETNLTPDFLHTFPFQKNKIIFPKGEEKLQIEPECALIFNATWENNTLISLEPVCFGASNDCSIRKEGAKKISQKKNWGPASKGFSPDLSLNTFNSSSIINDYRIASFLVRNGKAYAYGEDSAIRDYSYVYEKLITWMLNKFNNQQNEGPAEEIHKYLIESGCPEQIMVSIGATRYTKWGETNFLQTGDEAVVVLYPESKYSKEQIAQMVEQRIQFDSDVSVLRQIISQ